jgi:hypothetical protein
MDDTTRGSRPPLTRRPPAHEIAEQLRLALVARAERLGLDPTSIRIAAPSALIARSPDGGLLRMDFRAYARDELTR